MPDPDPRLPSSSHRNRSEHANGQQTIYTDRVCTLSIAAVLYFSSLLTSCSDVAGDTVHLLHVVPEPSMVHVWPGMYVPPDDDAEQDEVTLCTETSSQGNTLA